MRIDFKTLKNTFYSILIKYGFSEEAAEQISLTFAEATFDGIFSHGINRFPRLINEVKTGIVKPDATPRLINGMHAFQQWDGMQGPGILNALHCADKSVDLARDFGIGCVGLRNTNHWMRGGTYGWRVADEGFLFMGWSNTIPNMPPWGGEIASLGNNPFIMAIPHTNGHIVLDMAMSQYSFGKIEWHQKCGIDLPEYGGYNLKNELTRNPTEILESERILPTGLWKGSAFSLVLDLAAAILSGGHTSQKIGELPAETSLSQVFISLNIERYLSKEQIGSLIQETLLFLTRDNENAQYPGQRSIRNRTKHQTNGIEIQDDIWMEIRQL